MQLSQQQEFSKVDEPLIAVFAPIRISSQMDTRNKVIDVALGEESSIFVTENLDNNETEVFACGHNLKGELGVGFLRHVTDINKVEGLSNYKIKVYLFELYSRLLKEKSTLE
jgi:alpha-tubulin suppressor-like RCC1 family protein